MNFKILLSILVAVACNAQSFIARDLYLVPSSALPNYNYRVHPWAVHSGSKILVDISGPNSVIHTDQRDNYKFCVVLIAGECTPGSIPPSAPGDVYVNAPFVSQMSSAGAQCRCGLLGCDPNLPPPPTYIMPNDIDIAEMQAGFQGIQEVAIDRGNDPDGRGVRFLTSAFSRRCTQSVFWNSREVAPGGWIFTTVDQLDGVNSQPVLIKKPVAPPTTSSNQNDFLPLPCSSAGG